MIERVAAAGVSGSFKPFLEADPQDLQAVAQTNLRGALLCTRSAIRAMSSEHQQRRGHIFNMDGAGADGVATPNYAAYGATKAGIAALMQSLTAECEEGERDVDVGIHTLSPGMVLTALLLEGATERNKQVFNVLCEQPETAAAYLVPRVRTVVARQNSMAYIRFLTSAPLPTGRNRDRPWHLLASTGARPVQRGVRTLLSSSSISTASTVMQVPKRSRRC